MSPLRTRIRGFGLFGLGGSKGRDPLRTHTPGLASAYPPRSAGQGSPHTHTPGLASASPHRSADRGPLHTRARGFVLVATLWALAALAVLAAYIDGVVAEDLRHAVEVKRALEVELARRSTETTLVYLLATGRMNHRALILEEEQRFSDWLPEGEYLPDHGDGELLVTGAVYARADGIRFSVQDEGGLVSVNAPRYLPFAALLRHVGISDSQVEGIVARVEDFIDSDNVLNLNGAERYDYLQGGEPPPLNWIMTSPDELRSVLGVNRLLDPAQWERLRPLLTTRSVYSYNFNTMRPELLAALLGLDDAGVLRILEERERGSLWRLSRIAMLSGVHLNIDELEVVLLPSSFMRIAVWHEDEDSRQLSGISMTPFGDSAPWRKDYRYSEFITATSGVGTSLEPLLPPPTPLLE